MASSVGIPSKKTYDLMTAKVGGPENVGYLHMDIKNYIRSKRMRSMEMGDAGGILQYFQKMVVEDPGFVYSLQLDAEDQITNFFWADSRMMNDYNVFGDVVCFDTTYRINNQAQPFAPFVGVNHHKQSILFGAALMYDETIESFEWVFKAFLNAMSNKQPKTILTDQDKAMAQAISSVLPDTYHRICVWHMYQNARKHLSHAFSSIKSFSVDFSKLVYDYDEEEDFLHGWESMLDKYNLRKNTWLQRLFSEKEKWALVYGRTTFCADMKSTQRNESVNSVLRHYLNNTHYLLEFFEHFEGVVNDRRNAELRADFKMTQSEVVVFANIPLLIRARNFYTPKIFKLFQEEYRKGLSYRVKLCVECDTIDTFMVRCPEKKREYTVTCDKSGFTIHCSCKNFEFTGILCGHALRVLFNMQVEEIPDQYMLKRWSKHAKVASSSISQISSLFVGDVTLLKRYKVLSCLSMKLNTRAAENEQAFKVAMEGLCATTSNVEKAFNSLSININEPSGLESEETGNDTCVSEPCKENDDNETTNQVKGLAKEDQAHKERARIRGCLEKRKKTRQSSKVPIYTLPPTGPIMRSMPTYPSDQGMQGLYQNVGPSQIMYQQAQFNQVNPYMYQQAQFNQVRPYTYQQFQGPPMPSLMYGQPLLHHNQSMHQHLQQSICGSSQESSLGVGSSSQGEWQDLTNQMTNSYDN